MISRSKGAICGAVPPRSGSTTPRSGRHPHLPPLSLRIHRRFDPIGALAHRNRWPLAFLPLAGACLISLYGCLDPLPEGTFACNQEGRSSGCPRGWYCRYDDEAENELRCYRTPGEESARRADAATPRGDPDEDSGVDDADSDAEEGGVDGGAACFMEYRHQSLASTTLTKTKASSRACSSTWLILLSTMCAPLRTFTQRLAPVSAIRASCPRPSSTSQDWEA